MGRIFKGVLWVVGTIAFLAIAVPVIGLVGIPVALDALGPTASQNFRLSIVIDDNGREVVGSTVYQISNSKFSRRLDVIAERAVVDLGDRGLLFVAATEDWGAYAELHFARSFCIDPQLSNKDNPRYDTIKKIEVLPEGSFLDLSAPMSERMRSCFPERYDRMEKDREGSLPLILRFRDFSDPTTVEKVDPLNLEATYGPGVRLVRIRLETTSAPISRSMEPAPPWLRKGVWLQVLKDEHPYSSSIITGLLLDEVKREGAAARMKNGY